MPDNKSPTDSLVDAFSDLHFGVVDDDVADLGGFGEAAADGTAAGHRPPAPAKPATGGPAHGYRWTPKIHFGAAWVAKPRPATPPPTERGKSGRAGGEAPQPEQAAPVGPQVPPASTALPEVMNVIELAALLRVDRKSAYALVARGEVPGVRRIGRTIRISRDAVLDWLRQGGVARGRRRP
jgi:excisionase family DNA binding protein